MTAAEILGELADRGVLIASEGPFLRLYPASAVTPELLAGIRERKDELLEVLRAATRKRVALPARAEWTVLAVLARRGEVRPLPLAAATGLPQRALDQALGNLLRRREIVQRAGGALRLHAH
jgi:sugar phosphate isomerase/epimerase